MSLFAKQTLVYLVSTASDSFYTKNLHCRNFLLDAQIRKTKKKKKNNQNWNKIQSNATNKSDKKPFNSVHSLCIMQSTVLVAFHFIFRIDEFNFTSENEGEERLIYCFNSSTQKKMPFFFFCIFYSMSPRWMWVFSFINLLQLYYYRPEQIIILFFLFSCSIAELHSQT